MTSPIVPKHHKCTESSVCVCTATSVEALRGTQQKQLLSLSVLDSRVEEGLGPPKDRQ